MATIEQSLTNPARVTVYGEYEPDYGRPQIGSVTKLDNRKYVPTAPDGRELDLTKTRAAAISSLEVWAAENMSAASVLRDYEDVSAGGQRLTFLRRVFSHHRCPAIVAVIHDGDDTCQTSWNEDGVCNLFGTPHQNDTKNEKARRANWKLVKREPEATEEMDASAPRM